ncbi:ABC transporter permease [Natrarchaeobius chitinivorans]|uniref:ABC transporter permease n=1 Tax=Natrarchaeobius chitinivorans TaxID=1679083 RepID=A0A3N6M1H8_NATCH|nr:ABC transporter permease [Natrarchaeobius chitinivorans]
MRGYVLKRIAHALLVVYLVTTVLFIGIRSVPGDPAVLILGRDADPAAMQELRESLGLNEPIYVQYVRWMSGIMRGDFGNSLFTNQPVTDTIFGLVEPTISIAIVAMIIAIFIAIPAGIISAVRQYSIEDDIVTFVSFIGLSQPSFFTGILLLLIFAGHFQLLPAFGYNPISEGILPWLSSIILPATAAGISSGAVLMRMVRSSMLDVLNEDYMRTAEAKGLDKNLILFKHGLQNALIPVLTLGGLLFGALLGGTVTLEIVFGINGIGRLVIQSISRRDFPVIQGVVIIIAFVFVMLNLVVDLLYTAINPKIRY